MVRLAFFVLLVWTAGSIPMAVLIGTLLGRLSRTVEPAPVVVRPSHRVVDLSSH